MPKEVMTRSASDNEYLHKDFHGALSCGIQYLHEHYGEEAVRSYLHRFAKQYYAPLREKLITDGLAALHDHFADVYAREGGTITQELTDDKLVLQVKACPAVTHMRANNYPVADLFVETTRTVNEALCDGTPYTAELQEYDEKTGASLQIFRRRTT